MADPSGGIGKASQQMMQELQRQMQSAQEQQGAGKAQFQDMLAQQTQQAQAAQDPTKVQAVQPMQQAQNAADVLRTAANNPSKLDVKPIEAVDKAKEATGLKGILGQVVEGQNKMDKIIEMATSGKSYSNQDLLAIQAAVYKFSQELELTSKVVEKATSGIKQTMQTQV